MTRPL